jgi:hypothetical protein
LVYRNTSLGGGGRLPGFDRGAVTGSFPASWGVPVLDGAVGLVYGLGGRCGSASGMKLVPGGGRTPVRWRRRPDGRLLRLMDRLMPSSSGRRRHRRCRYCRPYRSAGSGARPWTAAAPSMTGSRCCRAGSGCRGMSRATISLAPHVMDGSKIRLRVGEPEPGRRPCRARARLAGLEVAFRRAVHVPAAVALV